MCRVGFTGYDAPRVMFPSVVVRPEMPCIMAGMDLKDSLVACTRLVLLVTMHFALSSLPWFAGPLCKALWPLWTKRTVAVSFTMLVLLVTMHLALCSLVCRPVMLDIMAVMDQKDSHVMVQRQSLMVQTVRQTIDFLQLLYKVVDVPVDELMG